MPAPKRKVGVLTRCKILSEKLISEKTFNCECVQDASYSLRLGDDYYIPKASSDNSKITEDEILKCSDKNDVLKIPGYSSIVFSTEEELNMPNNVIGRFDLRPKYAMQGLVLQVGTQVEPNYKGRLFGLLLNFSSEEISIPRWGKLLAIEFSYLYEDVPANDDKQYGTLLDFIGSKGVPVKGTLENYLRKITDIAEKSEKTKQDIERRLNEINGEKTNRIRQGVSYVIGVAGILIAILIPLMIFYFTKATYDRGSFPSEIIEELKENNELLQEENKILRQNFHDIDAKLDSLVISNTETINTVK